VDELDVAGDRRAGGVDPGMRVEPIGRDDQADGAESTGDITL
jgi:hypothetical protein